MMSEQYLRKLLKLNIEREVVKIISSVPFIYLPPSYKSLLRKFENDYLVEPFHLYFLKEKLLGGKNISGGYGNEIFANEVHYFQPAAQHLSTD